MRQLTEKEIELEDDSNIIWIANSRTHFWDSSTRKLAEKELQKRNISVLKQNEYQRDWSIEAEREWEHIYSDSQLWNTESNLEEKNKFTILEKLSIIMYAPILIIRADVGPSIFSLYKDKKMKMFWEKVILIIIGILFWTGIYIYSQSNK